MNKPSICSVVVLEVIEFSKKSATKQTETNALLNEFIQQAVMDIPQENRMIVAMPGGGAIACNGPLEDALEDALFISIHIRDEILKHNTYGATPLYVQFGIHLGDAREVKNALVGEGVDEANRIMSFACPNQILVSNVYFEMASKLTQDIARMFEKYEMHAHEHDIYAVRLLKESAADTAPTMPEDIADVEVGTVANKINWSYVGLGCLALATFFVLGKLITNPNQPTITMLEPAQIEQKVEQAAEKPAETTPAAEPTTEPVAAANPVENTVAVVPKDAEVAQTKADKKVVKKAAQKTTEKTTEKNSQKTTEKAEAPTKSVEKTAEKPAETKPEASDKSTWESVKDSVKSGTERKCTQAEIAMNQCNK